MAIILFMSNDFIGPQMACIGLAQSLKQRGHRIYFCLQKESYQRFLNEGFSEENFLELNKKNGASDDRNSIDELIEKINEYGFVTGVSPLDKVRQIRKVDLIRTNFVEPLKVFDKQIENYLNKIEPDLIIYDGEIIPPSILFWQNCPWVYLFCSNPIGLFDSDLLPPFLSDFNTKINDDNEQDWQHFRDVLNECYFNRIREAQQFLCKELSYPDPNKIQWMHDNRFFIHSPYLNLYQYPKELDYDDCIQIDPKQYYRVDSFCRFGHDFMNAKQAQELLSFIDDGHNSSLNSKKKNLIYFSLGSMGACNLNLMQKLIDILSKTKHKYLISTGPLNDRLSLGKNMYGQSSWPQIWLFSNIDIDLFISHGGNNSLCEAFTYGIPCLIMPLFYDQFHNAKRIEEKQLGKHIDPFNIDDDSQLINAINDLLNDNQLKIRMKSIGQRILNDGSKINCCLRLESLINQFKRSKLSSN